MDTWGPRCPGKRGPRCPGGRGGRAAQGDAGAALPRDTLWKCSSPRLYQLPLQWFADIERDFLLPTPPEGAAEYCATRRGAGLPFMIQALVTTELATESTVPRGRLLARCVELCLAGGAPPSPVAGGAPPSPVAAARAQLVLRALFRHAEPGAGATARAVMLAVRGFDADTWMVRNSSTLLFAALTVRMFGVQRGRDARRLCARNRMTGRIFFLRYPELYDFLLEQLQTASAEQLRPSLFPTLLLLARLYPSALEGTVSNLKLERFLPLVAPLAGSRDAATRRLAARALQPLVAPHRYNTGISTSTPFLLRSSLLRTRFWLNHQDVTTRLLCCH
ncbi:hypothetical protein MSG28_004842 [Choristoneura fumiferana]|uniref:Uncharacterized protein n=1 Tax=Choristoneura fumiferana TaxID=7141 RepID=A0ACC0K7S7_CHOFU|nr:hypothetical protein MSG28_004842 [Choristoneura fumiferana]